VQHTGFARPVQRGALAAVAGRVYSGADSCATYWVCPPCATRGLGHCGRTCVADVSALWIQKENLHNRTCIILHLHRIQIQCAKVGSTVQGVQQGVDVVRYDCIQFSIVHHLPRFRLLTIVVLTIDHEHRRCPWRIAGLQYTGGEHGFYGGLQKGDVGWRQLEGLLPDRR
jgi:hypothetical protein